MQLRLKDFEGAWAIDRRIDDFAACRIGTMTGRAVFEPAPWGLLYTETGTLMIEGQAPMQASRSYRWSTARGRIALAFDDGGPFHDFDPTDPRAHATHLCGDDEYRVIYTFTRWPDWRAEWRVNGPRKDYRMSTNYTRER